MAITFTVDFPLTIRHSDILDRTLQESAAVPPTLQDAVTGDQPGNQPKDPLPRVTSLNESMTTAVGMAERALCQSADMLRDIDSFLSTTATTK